MKINNHQKRITVSHILVVCMALLIGLQVYVSNRIATSGKTISMLEIKAATIEEDNRKLLSDNVEKYSLSALSQRASQLGFVQPTTILHLEYASTKLAMQP